MNRLILEKNNRLAHISAWEVIQIHQGPFLYYATAAVPVAYISSTH